jgi:hypothetical protein
MKLGAEQKIIASCEKMSPQVGKSTILLDKYILGLKEKIG